MVRPPDPDASGDATGAAAAVGGADAVGGGLFRPLPRSSVFSAAFPEAFCAAPRAALCAAGLPPASSAVAGGGIRTTSFGSDFGVAVDADVDAVDGMEADDDDSPPLTSAPLAERVRPPVVGASASGTPGPSSVGGGAPVRFRVDRRRQPVSPVIRKCLFFS